MNASILAKAFKMAVVTVFLASLAFVFVTQNAGGYIVEGIWYPDTAVEPVISLPMHVLTWSLLVLGGFQIANWLADVFGWGFRF